MTRPEIIEKTVAYVKAELQGAEGGHDWWHIERVRRLALTIAATEPADPFIVELGALLHDIADAKFHGGDETVGVGKARAFLAGCSVEESVTEHIAGIISNISFRGGHGKSGFFSPELAVVQDADRLDAMGAIGIARAFSYGGYKGRALYDPAVPPNPGMSAGEYKRSTAPTINHFYEKLLLLREHMNTDTGRRMAEERHRFMERYLEEFFGEWEGKK